MLRYEVQTLPTRVAQVLQDPPFFIVSLFLNLSTCDCEAKESGVAKKYTSNAEFIRALLLDSKQKRVLLQQVDNRWDLPYFAFRRDHNGDIAEYCTVCSCNCCWATMRT